MNACQPLSDSQVLLRRAVDNLQESVLLSDLIRDSSPSHLIGASVFLVRADNELVIAKIGDRLRLQKERDTLEQLSARLSGTSIEAVAAGIRFPMPAQLVASSEESMSILITPFLGYHTLESFRAVGQRGSGVTHLRRAIEGLAHLGIFWPSAIPRNIVVCEPSNLRSPLGRVEWERGFTVLPDAVSHGCSYIRSMALIEEAMTMSEALLPMWSYSWPPPDELWAWQSDEPLYCSVPLDDTGDARMVALANLLSIPKRLSDSQFLRLIEVLCALADNAPTLSSVLFAADHIDSFCNLAGAPTDRLRATVLAWYLRHSGQHGALSELYERIVDLGCRVAAMWRACARMDQIEGVATWVHSTFSDLLDGIAGCGLRAGIWPSLALDQCTEFVLRGLPDARCPNYRVVYWLGER